MDVFNAITNSSESVKSIPAYVEAGDYLSLGRIAVALIFETGLSYMMVAAFFYLFLMVLRPNFMMPRKIQKRRTPWIQVRREIGWSMVAFLVFGIVGLICVVAREMGWSKEYQDVSQYGWAYLAFSVWLIYTVHDIWHYIMHRALHEVPFLFRHVHRVHHTFRTPTAFAADAFHPLDALVNISFLPLIVFLFPVHSTVMQLYLVNVVVLNIVGHTGFEFLPRGMTKHWLFQWINSPTAHDIHHSHVHCNYGLYTNVLDRCLGTFHPKTFEIYEKVTGPKQGDRGSVNTGVPSTSLDAMGG